MTDTSTDTADQAPDPTPDEDAPVFACPYCTRTYKDEEWYARHLTDKHAERIGAPPLPGHEPQLPPATGPLTEMVAPRTLLDPDGLRLTITYDEMNLAQLEDELGDFVRLTAEGPQVKVLLGEDLAEGWMPLHAHHTVVVFGEDAHPFTLTPAAARALGLRE